MSRLAAIFDQARRENRAAFIGYLTAGDLGRGDRGDGARFRAGRN
jgi:tryptophan synthase alpha subunit